MSRATNSAATSSIGESPEGSGRVPLVTIGMPVYNGAGYLEEAVCSLLNQTEKDFVLLISDNCSTDETPEICARLAAEDPCISYVKQEANIGVVANFEYVLRAARSPFFMWAAHDDLWARRFLEESLRLLGGAPDAIGCAVGVRYEDKRGKVSTVPILPPPALGSKDVVTRARSLFLTGAELVYGVFRRNMLPAAEEAFPNITNGDYVFLFRLALRRRFVTTEAVLATKRVVGYEVEYTPDGRITYPKMSGPEAHLHRRSPHAMCLSMLSSTWSAPLVLWKKTALAANIVGFWFVFWRRIVLGDSPDRVRRAVAGRRYGRASLMVARHAILRPSRAVHLLLRPSRALFELRREPGGR